MLACPVESGIVGQLLAWDPIRTVPAQSFPLTARTPPQVDELVPAEHRREEEDFRGAPTFGTMRPRGGAVERRYRQGHRCRTEDPDYERKEHVGEFGG